MSRTSARRLTLALLGAVLTACGGGDGPVSPPPTPTASITIGTATGTVIAGATTSVAVTLTRGGGYAGAVTVTAASLPAGVTASSETIAGGATTATVTLTAAPTAPAVSLAGVSITGSGSGVTIAPQALSLTVTPAAGARIALSAAAGSVVAGASSTVTVTLTRVGGFTGDVVVAATSLPIGVTVASQTISGAATTATLTIAAASSATAGTGPAISITATGAGVTIAPQPYALTITASASGLSQIGSDILSSDGNFASRVALSANGNRVVVGAYTTSNGTTRVYDRSGSTWAQVGADIIGEAAGDRAGSSVDINAAGTRIAVGAPFNGGGGASSGHVRVYDLVGSTWTQVGADIDGTGFADQSGWSVAISGSGNRLLVGAVGRNYARVFDLVGTTWTQVGATLTGANEGFGHAVDVSADGTTVAISEPFRSLGNPRPGSVSFYRLSGSVWTLLGSTLIGTADQDSFGFAISLSSNGSRVVVSAPGNTEGGIDGGGNGAGQVRVFDLVGGTWTPVGAKINGDVSGAGFAFAVRISDAGTRFAATSAGQSIAKVYTLVSGVWMLTGVTNITPGSVRTEGLALSADGLTVAAGYINGAPRRVRLFSITP